MQSEQETVGTFRKFSRVCSILEHYGRDSSKLVPILQEVQNEYRYLPEPVLTFVATSLGIPPSRVYGVATFYSHFTLEPKGKYVIRVCDGTACHVKGSETMIEAIRSRLGLKADERTTSDLLFTLETVSCLGACGLAPVVVVNDDVHGQMTKQKIDDLISEIEKKERANGAGNG